MGPGGLRGGRRGLTPLVVALGILAASCGSNLSHSDLRSSNLAFSVASRDQSRVGEGNPSSFAASPNVVGGTSPTGSSGPAAQGGATSPSGRSRPGTKPEIVLGSYGEQSGLIGAAVAAVPVAVRAWVADVNARGGLNGHPVRLIMRETGGDPGRTLTVVRQMAEENRVLAFFGAHAVNQSLITPYLESNKIPLVGGTPHEDADLSPVFFRPGSGSTDGQYRGYWAVTLNHTRARKVAVINVAECGNSCAAGKEIIKRYAPKVGGQVVYEADVSIAQPDFTAEVLAARNAGAEAVMSILDFASHIRLIRSAHRQGWRPPFISSAAVYDDAFERAEPDVVEGALLYSIVAPYSISRAMRPYVQAVRRFVPGGRMGGLGADVWAAGKLLERAARSFGDRPTRRQVFDGIYALRHETLGGLVPPITFPRGPHRAVNLCVAAVRFSAGGWEAPGGEQFLCSGDDGTIRRVRS